jgi:F420-non-reducing hydrogenase iron-sulfur subunit
VHYIQDVLETMGLERDRIEMIFVSAAEGARFRQLVTEMTNRIKKLGPTKLRAQQEAALEKAAAKARKRAARKK